MNEQRLIEALNDSINRIANGQTVEDCLRGYPKEISDQLRPLLQAGRGLSRVRPSTPELRAMRSHIDPRIKSLIEETNFPSSHMRPLPSKRISLLVATMLLVFMGLGLFLKHRNDNLFAIEPIQTLDNPAQITTLTAAMTLTNTPTLTETQTATSTQRPQQTQTMTLTATQTITVTMRPFIRPTASPLPTTFIPTQTDNPPQVVTQIPLQPTADHQEDTSTDHQENSSPVHQEDTSTDS